MTFFPAPYPDELFYSMLLRYSKQSGNYHFKHTLLDIYNTASRRSNPILQLDVSNVLTQLEVTNLSAEKIIKNHTLYTYYSTFVEDGRSEMVTKALLEGDSKGVYNLLGITSSSIILHKNMRHCSHCFKEDVRNYGETYWRRIHQTPGVLFCPIHNVPLLEHKVRIDETSQNGFIDPNDLDKFQSSGVFESELSQQLLFIAQETKYMLEDKRDIVQEQNRVQLKDVYKKQLQRMGIANENGRINRKLLLRQLENFYYPSLMNKLGFNTRKKPLFNNFLWLLDLLRRESRLHHPLKHILVIHFLFGSFERFMNYRELNHIKSVDNKSNLVKSSNLSSKKILSKREEFIGLVKQNEGLSITELRLKSPGLYGWLYRNDKAWFKDFYTKNLKKKSVLGIPEKVNWDGRDRRLVVELSALVNNWNLLEEERGKSIQITRTSIASFSERPYFITKKLHKLPNTSIFINGAIETDAQYRIRRLSKAVTKLRLEGRNLSKWNILKEAGIRKEYIGKEIEQALRELL